MKALYRSKTQDVAPMTFDKIVDHLYLGDFRDFEILMDNRMAEKPYVFIDARGFYNVLSGDADAFELMVKPLTIVSKACAELIKSSVNVLVYCQAGMERSPFLVALILYQMGKGTLEECYDFVKLKHPQTIQYQQWVDGFTSQVS